MLLASDDRQPRAPLINMGTHHRTYALDAIVRSFVTAPFQGSATSPRNVVSLGSGSDSRFWRLRKRWQKEHPTESWPLRHWVEVDFAETVERKAQQLARGGDLKRWCSLATARGDNQAPTAESRAWLVCARADER